MIPGGQGGAYHGFKSFNQIQAMDFTGVYPARLGGIRGGLGVERGVRSQPRQEVDDDVVETLDPAIGDGQNGAWNHLDAGFLLDFAATAVRQGFAGFQPSTGNMPQTRLWRTPQTDQQYAPLIIEDYATHANGGYGRYGPRG